MRGRFQRLKYSMATNARVGREVAEVVEKEETTEEARMMEVS